MWMMDKERHNAGGIIRKANTLVIVCPHAEKSALFI
jgi:hypothetical protein